MNMVLLRHCIQESLPLLRLNLETAKNRFLKSKSEPVSVTYETYIFVRQRYNIAIAVINQANIDPVSAYQSCAHLAVDLREGGELYSDKIKAEQIINSFWECYRSAGYTEVDGFYNIPMLPQE